MIKLQHLIREISIKTTINNQYEVLTSSQNGIVSQEEYFNKQVASQNNIGYKIIKKGQFTYRSMSDTGKFYINRLTTRDIGIVSPAYPVFEISSPNLLPEYLELFFKSNLFQEQISNKSSGSTRLALRYSKLESVLIPLPDLQSQQRIVDSIHTIEKIIAQENHSLFLIDELIQSRFVDLFSNYEKDIVPMNQICSICRGASPRPISAYITEDVDGVNWIKIGDVGENDIYITHTDERITKAGAEKSRKVKPGDFILSNSMSFGRPYILGIHGCVHDGWLIISDYEKRLNPIYFYYEIRSEFVQRQFDGSASGSTVRNLNSDLVRKVLIHVPPMELQEKFSEFVGTVDKIKTNTQKRIRLYKEFLSKKMDEYFK